MPSRFSKPISRKAIVKDLQVSQTGQESNLNPIVSQLSKFLDDIWDFALDMKNPSVYNKLKRISWGFNVKEEELFTDPKYHQLLFATKQLFHSLLRHTEEGPAQKPASLLHRWENLKIFIIYLATRPRPILTYDRVSPELVARYVKRLRQTNKSCATLYAHFRSLSVLFLYRRKMSSSLLFDPFGNSSAAKEAGYNSEYRDQHRTDYIPDEILSKLIPAAMEYVNVWGPHILKASTLAKNVRREAQDGQKTKSTSSGSSSSSTSRKTRKGTSRETMIRYHVRQELRKFDQVLTGSSASLVRPRLSGPNDLQMARTLLRTACIVLLTFVTGIRISELLSIKAGCIEVEKKPDGEFIWLHSTLYKIQPASEGRPARWLGGPLALKAVSTLERLTEETRKQSGCSYLVVPVTRSAFHKWNGKDPLADAFDPTYLHDFFGFIGLKNALGRSPHIHSHMFRRTFARHVVRCDTTNLMALKEHFKHCSVAMTDGYVGIDEELQDLLDSENDLLSLDSFDKALRSPTLSGRQGKAIVAMVDRAIGDGRLPIEFRGEAGGHIRKKMAREFIEAGQRIYPCGASNFCWFREDSADCTKGDRPVVEICNSIGCANCVIEREEHGEYWQNIVTEGEALLAMKPKGGPYKARLISITRIAKKVVSDLA
jgi:integrase